MSDLPRTHHIYLSPAFTRTRTHIRSPTDKRAACVCEADQQPGEAVTLMWKQTWRMKVGARGLCSHQ